MGELNPGWPRVEVIVDGERHWMTMHDASVVLDDEWSEAVMTNQVLDVNGVTRTIHKEEMELFDTIARVYSENKYT